MQFKQLRIEVLFQASVQNLIAFMTGMIIAHLIITLLKIDVFYRQSIMIYWLLLCSCIPQQSVVTVVI